MSYDSFRVGVHQRSGAIVLLLGLSSGSSFVLAGGATDGSVGPMQSFFGHFTVPETWGTLKGSNLFHSFSRFNIGPGECATFTTATASIRNVISRVTGGEVSTVYGRLKLDAAAGSRPDFYFVNPAGVVFGAGAKVDVPAGLHLCTAQRLKFADGFAWDTSAPTASALTVAPPEAFGFLGNQAAASITLNNKDVAGTPSANSTNFELQPGGTLSIAAGAIQLDNVNATVPEGKIQLSASGSDAAEIHLARSTSDRLSGSIATTNASLMTEGTGSILLQGGQMTFQDGLISSQNRSDAPAGRLGLVAYGNVTLDGTIFGSRARAGGKGGNVSVSVGGELAVFNKGRISSSTSGTGAAGAIKVEAAAMRLDAGGKGAPAGPEGLRPGIRSQAIGSATGDAGPINVEVSGHLAILGGSGITSNTESTGAANLVDVKADSLTIDNQGFRLVTGIGSTALGKSHGPFTLAKVHVESKKDLTIRNGGQITSGTSTDKPAGSVDITTGTLLIDRGGGELATGVFSQPEASSATSSGGTINITAAGDVIVLGGGQITTGTQAGPGGRVDIQARAIILSGEAAAGPSRISALAAEKSSGEPGNVLLVARDNITLSNNAKVTIENDAMRSAASLQLSTKPTLTLRAPRISLTDGAKLTAASSNDIEAGDVQVEFTDRLIMRNAEITTTARDGNGGAIDIRGGRAMLLDNAQVKTSVEGNNNGNGGDISLNASALAMNTGFIRANTNAPHATGGRVSVDVRGLLVSGNGLILGGNVPIDFQPDAFALNVIQAAAADGVSGLVDVTSPALDIAGSLKGLSAEFIDFGALGKDLCRVGAGSSLTPIGRGGLRPSTSGTIRPEGHSAPRVKEGELWPSTEEPRGVSMLTSRPCN
jgi:filamentous hemagglutinin family protein